MKKKSKDHTFVAIDQPEMDVVAEEDSEITEECFGEAEQTKVASKSHETSKSELIDLDDIFFLSNFYQI